MSLYTDQNVAVLPLRIVLIGLEVLAHRVHNPKSPHRRLFVLYRYGSRRD